MKKMTCKHLDICIQSCPYELSKDGKTQFITLPTSSYCMYATFIEYRDAPWQTQTDRSMRRASTFSTCFTREQFSSDNPQIENLFICYEYKQGYCVIPEMLCGHAHPHPLTDNCQENGKGDLYCAFREKNVYCIRSQWLNHTDEVVRKWNIAHPISPVRSIPHGKFIPKKLNRKYKLFERYKRTKNEL